VSRVATDVACADCAVDTYIENGRVRVCPCCGSRTRLSTQTGRKRRPPRLQNVPVPSTPEGRRVKTLIEETMRPRRVSLALDYEDLERRVLAHHAELEQCPHCLRPTHSCSGDCNA
jgi:hypothetical protein